MRVEIVQHQSHLLAARAFPLHHGSHLQRAVRFVRRSRAPAAQGLAEHEDRGRADPLGLLVHSLRVLPRRPQWLAGLLHQLRWLLIHADHRVLHIGEPHAAARVVDRVGSVNGELQLGWNLNDRQGASRRMRRRRRARKRRDTLLTTESVSSYLAGVCPSPSLRATIRFASPCPNISDRPPGHWTSIFSYRSSFLKPK